MKKQLWMMLLVSCALSSVYADGEHQDDVAPAAATHDAEDGFDGVTIENDDLREYVAPSAAEQMKQDIGRRAINQRNAAQDAVQKAVNNQLDLMEEQLQKWLEEKLPLMIEAALAKLSRKVSSGANSLYEGAKDKVSRGWGWFTGASSSKADGSTQGQEKEALYRAVPVEELLEYDNLN